MLNTKEEYDKALERFEEIFSAKIGTKESDETDVLAVLIKDYEDKHYAIASPDREIAFKENDAPLGATYL